MSEKLSGSEVFMDNSGFMDRINFTDIRTDTDIVSMAQQNIMYKIGKCEYSIRYYISFISDTSLFNIYTCHSIGEHVFLLMGSLVTILVIYSKFLQQPCSNQT